MIKNANTKFFYTLLAMLVTVPHVAQAAIRVGNAARSNAAGYQQVNKMRYQQVQPAPQTQQQLQPQVQTGQPMGAITANDTAAAQSGTMDEKMEKCSSIYPNGAFEWAKPTAGIGAGGAATCTAVVELRAIGAGQRGEDVTIARVNLAAGQSLKCNVDEFPEYSRLNAPDNLVIQVPADHEPTTQDVINVMNKEQKQNAFVKILGGTVIGGLGGNIAGDNEPGKDGILGGGKDKVTGTVIGALGGAALMAGNVYSGKVAGDMILSAGVNAAAGAVVGNIAASGDSVLRIERCTKLDGTDTKCLWGLVIESEELKLGNEAATAANEFYAAYFNTVDETVIVCKNKRAQSDDENVIATECSNKDLINIKLDKYPDKSLAEAEKNKYDLIEGPNAFYYDPSNKKMQSVEVKDGDSKYAKILSADLMGKTHAAMIVDVDDKTFGYKSSDWEQLKSTLSASNLYGRGPDNKPFELTTKYELSAFHPMYEDADSGSIIDLGNKARLKGTLTGAGVGGALGAFTAYQGAQSEIEARWLAAVREYKDSLQKVVCMTGGRYLSQYNDVIFIPAMPE